MTVIKAVTTGGNRDEWSRLYREWLAMAKSVDDLCRANEITLERLCEESGLARDRVEAIYLGRWTPSPTERAKIAAVFDVGVDEIVWGHKTPIQHIYGEGPG